MLRKSYLCGTERMGYVDDRKMTNGFVFLENVMKREHGDRAPWLQRRLKPAATRGERGGNCGVLLSGVDIILDGYAI